jgi:phosphatidate cytidylyltransferase
MMAGVSIELSPIFIPLCMAIAVSGVSNRLDYFIASIIGGSLILLATSIKQGTLASVFGVSGAVYIGGLLGCLGLLRVQPDGREWCFVVLFVTWANDMGAYFGGRAFGKRKLAPTISPGKSWEGACFGLGAGVLTGACLSSWTGFAVAEGAVVGALLAVMAQVGDLVESKLKRYCQVKDSGKAIPGHGGFLDRFDSLLFTGAGGLLIKSICGLLLYP